MLSTVFLHIEKTMIPIKTENCFFTNRRLISFYDVQRIAILILLGINDMKSTKPASISRLASSFRIENSAV